MGNGILVAGSNRNVIERNVVFDHDLVGIGLVPFPEEEANDVVPDESTWDVPCTEAPAEPPAVNDPQQPAPVLWDATPNSIVGNAVSQSGDLDHGFVSPPHALDTPHPE